MDHDHQAEGEPPRSRFQGTLAVSRPLPHVRQARHRHLVQADHSRAAVVLYPAHYDHSHVHGRIRRHCKNQHRRASATAVLPCRHLPLDLLFGMSEPDEQNVHRKREHVRQSLFSATRRAACNSHKQPRATQHSNGLVPYRLRLLPYLHRSTDSP